MKRRFYILLVFFGLTSCNGLFDINPPTEVKEEELFSQEQGFYDALIGVYVKATAQELYGQQLSYGFLDILANMYTVPAFSQNDYIQNFDYGHMYVKPAATSFWNLAYNLIANCNNILKYMPGKEALFYPGNYQLLEAETRALRAFLHFDLLRLYAPAPVTGSQQKAIPYVDAISKVPFPQLTVEEVLGRIIADLERSQELLEGCEPLFEEDAEQVASFMDYLTPRGFRLGRTTRLNYYSVSALLARVYLYKGDLQKAYSYASVVYKAEYAPFGDINIYSWTDDILTGFWLASNTIADYSKHYFSSDAASDKLLLQEDARKKIFEINRYQAIDVRYLKNFSTRSGGNEIFLNKYFSGGYCYPVIKRSEVYLILAETAKANQDDPYKYLNELRSARGLAAFPLNSTADPDTEIGKEYSKEFIGEGQLFYYYKRKNLQNYTTNNLRSITDMGEDIYKLPVPENEITFGEIE